MFRFPRMRVMARQALEATLFVKIKIGLQPIAGFDLVTMLVEIKLSFVTD